MRLLGFGVALCLGGCAVGDAVERDVSLDDGANEATSVAALVHVQHGRHAQAEVVARYVRAIAVDDDTLRVTGATLELPAPGTCVEPNGHGVRPSSVELVAAGATTLQQGEQKLGLLPRRLPDLSSLVSGVFYTATATELAPGEASMVLAGLEQPVSFLVPRPIDDLRIDGHALEQGATARIDVDGGPLQLDWRTEPGELVAVDVVGEQGTTRCSFDAGVARVLGRELFAEQGVLVLRRITQSESHADPFARIVIHAETSLSLAYVRR